MQNKVTTRVLNLEGLRSIAGAMDDTDSWLSSVKEREDVFERMMRDPRVFSLVDDRKGKVLQMYGSLTPSGNKAIDEACQEVFSFNLFYKLNNILLNAVPYGISMCEVVWEKCGGLYMPTRFVPIPRQAVGFTPVPGLPFGTPVLTLQGNVPVSGIHFLVHKNDDGTLSQWGSPALKAAYTFWKFKNMGVRFWASAAEKVGVPSILALFETKTTDEAKKRAAELTEALSGWESGSSGAFGNIKDIKVVTSQINDFDTLVKTCDAEIAYALTAQSLVTNESEYGTRAQADTHTRTFDIIIKNDAYKLQQTDQKLIDAFVELNFPGEKSPVYDIDSTDFADWEVIRDAINLGIPLSLSALYDKVHLPRPESTEDAFVKPQPSFGFSDRGGDDNFFLTR